MDVHPLDDSGYSALTIQMSSKMKLEKAEQTYKMKKQNVAMCDAKREQEQIWDLVKVMLIREKEQHGHAMAQGVVGTDCIKDQLTQVKLIRPQTILETVQEFSNLYKIVKKKKPIVKPVVEPPKSDYVIAEKLSEVQTVQPEAPTQSNNTKQQQQQHQEQHQEQQQKIDKNVEQNSAKSVLDVIVNTVDYEVEKRTPSSDR